MALSRAVLSLLFAALPLFAQTPAQQPSTAQYFVVFLRPAPDRKPLAKEDAERIQAAHMANIHKMADDGILVSAGPFDDTVHTISGIFIFKTSSLQTAQAIAAKDPTVLEHRNTVDVHGWQGPAGIGDEYFRLHKLEASTPENMQVHPLCMLFRGSNWDGLASTRESLLAQHRQYIGHLRSQGKLGAAGVIDAPDDMLELILFKALPYEDAQSLLAEDPAIKAGILRVELHHWWSSDHVLPW